LTSTGEGEEGEQGKNKLINRDLKQEATNDTTMTLNPL